MDFPAATRGKMLNDARTAQGLGPPFHCEFGRCRGAGEDETKYCSQHRCQWSESSPGGDGTACRRARAEAAFGRELFAHCLVHKCRTLGCRSARQSPMAYCTGHMCRMPACRGGSERHPADAPMYCAAHGCASAGCRRSRRWPAEEEPGAPEEDGGVVPSDATRAAGTGYCSRHARRSRRPPVAQKKKKRHGCATC